MNHESLCSVCVVRVCVGCVGCTMYGIVICVVGGEVPGWTMSLQRYNHTLIYYVRASIPSAFERLTHAFTMVTLRMKRPISLSLLSTSGIDSAPQ